MRISKIILKAIMVLADSGRPSYVLWACVVPLPRRWEAQGWVRSGHRDDLAVLAPAGRQAAVPLPSCCGKVVSRRAGRGGPQHCSYIGEAAQLLTSTRHVRWWRCSLSSVDAYSGYYRVVAWGLLTQPE
jgi:hypothetical protein